MSFSSWINSRICRKTMVYMFYITYISVYLAYYEMVCAKAGKCGINIVI